MKELMELRERLFVAISKNLGYGYKHYEGAMHLNMPSYFDEGTESAEWLLDIDLYVFGPNRRTRIEANSYEELMKMLETLVSSWENQLKADDICTDCGSIMTSMGIRDGDTDNPYETYWCQQCEPNGPY